MSGDDIRIVRRMCEGGNGVFHDACLAVCDEVERLRAAGDALAACVNQFGDTDNWTHDDGFLFHDEALAAVAAWEEVSRG